MSIRHRWLRFAEREPYFSVLAHDRYLSANLDDDATAAFLATGEGEVRELFENLFTHLNSRLSTQSVLEFGCGPGRLVVPFALRVGHVTAVDVSPSMLRVAAKHVAERGFVNVSFESLDEFRRDNRQFDLVNAHLVLQRIAPRDGEALVRELASRVADDGVSVLQIPCRIRESKVTAATRWLRSRVPPINTAVNLARRRPSHLPLMPTHVYDLDRVFAILEEHGLTLHYCVSVKHGDVDSVIIHSRKPPKPPLAAIPQRC